MLERGIKISLDFVKDKLYQSNIFPMIK